MIAFATSRPAEGYEFYGSFESLGDPLLTRHLPEFTYWWTDDQPEYTRPDWTNTQAPEAV